jgi:hypothetical protein
MWIVGTWSMPCRSYDLWLTLCEWLSFSNAVLTAVAHASRHGSCCQGGKTPFLEKHNKYPQPGVFSVQKTATLG